MASAEQEIPGHTETIEYEDDKGKWHMETASGRDRPHTIIKDVDWAILVGRERTVLIPIVDGRPE